MIHTSILLFLTACSTAMHVGFESETEKTFENFDALSNLDSVAVREPPQCDSNSQNRYTSLVCWLWDLKLSIPDMHIRKGLIGLTIHDMICSEFNISSTESEYIPAPRFQNNTISNGSNPLFDVKVTGISMQCIGGYKSGIVGGTVKVMVDNIGDKALHIQTAILSTFLKSNESHYSVQDSAQDSRLPIKVPHTANLTVCSTSLQVPKKGGISFSGSLSAKFVELFSTAIASHVTSALNSQICPHVKDLVDRNMTDALVTMDSFLQHFLFNKSWEHQLLFNGLRMQAPFNFGRNGENSIIIHEKETDLIQWNELSEMKKILEFISNFVNSHLDEGILLDLLGRVGWPISKDPSLSCKDCGYFFRGLNGLIRTFMDGGSWTVDLNRTFDIRVKSIGAISITLKNAIISGLDKINHSGVYPSSPRNVSPQVMIEKFAFDLGVDMKIFPTPGGLIQGSPLEESFNVFVNASDVLLDAFIDVGVIRENICNLTIADLKYPSHRWERLLKSLSHVIIRKVVSAATVSTIHVDPLNSSDILEKSLDAMINNVFTLILFEYEELVTKSLEAAIDGPLVQAMNKALANRITKMSSTETVNHQGAEGFKSAIGSTDFFRFNESIAIRRIHDFFYRERTVDAMNNYIACISSFLDVGTSLSNVPKLLSTSLLDGLDFLIQRFSFRAFEIDKTDVLKAVDASHLEFDAYTSSLKNVLSILGFAFEYPEEEIYATANLNSSLFGLGCKCGYRLVFNITQFWSKNLYDFLTEPTSTINNLSAYSGLYDLAISVDKLNIGVNMSYIEKGHVHPFLFESTTDDALGKHLTGILLAHTKFVQNGLNGLKQIYVGTKTPHPYEHHKREGMFSTAIGSQWSIVLLFVSFNICFFARLPLKKKSYGSKRNRPFPSNSPDSAIVNLSESSPASLVFHHKIPHVVRVVVPLSIIVTATIFMVSNYSVGAWVSVKFSRLDGSTEVTIPSVTSFSLGKTVTEMYHARVYTLMTLVLVFSGIWPYVKLIMMLVSWASPTSIIPFEARESLLVWLDALGKYSLVDSFVLVLMLVSFKFHIKFPGVGTIDSYVIPAFGFYLFLIATVLSLVIGHGVTFFHRFTLLPKLECSVSRRSICNHHFETTDSVNGVHFIKLSSMANICWALITSVCAFLLCIGATHRSFTFEFMGLLGEMLGDHRSTSYSLWTLGTSLPFSVDNPRGFGIAIIQVTFFFFALVMPFACLIILSVLYYVPLTLAEQQKVFTLAEIANAWSAIDVFLLSVLASMLELSQFARFMVGHYCDFMKDNFFQTLLGGEETCFSVESTVSYGALYLCTGVVMFNIIVYAGLRLAREAIEERLLREINELASCPGHSNSRNLSKWYLRALFTPTTQLEP